MIRMRNDAPLVSVLIVARNAGAFIDTAIRSARDQTFRDIEIVVLDDGSHDSTPDIAHLHAAADDRVRVIAGPCLGLSAVRNRSLAAARGRYAAILDADDIIEPSHIEHLVAVAEASGAQICAANMVQFAQNPSGLTTQSFVPGPTACRARDVGAKEYLEGGTIGGKSPSFGYLKPLFDLDFLRKHDIAYDEGLRIGEDFDLVFRAMLAGARFHLCAQATYFYRRHAQSTSHRLTSRDLEAMTAATLRYQGADPQLAHPIAKRLRNLEGALRQVRAIDALRSGRIIAAGLAIGTHRGAISLLARSFYESCRKRLGLWDDGFRNVKQTSCPQNEQAALFLRSMLQPTSFTR